MPPNPFRRLDLVLRRDHTLGTLLERLARLRGGSVLVDEPQGLCLTVSAAAELVASWAGGVVAAGVGRGEIVVIATPNGYEQLLLCLAVSRAGAVPAPVNDRMRPDEIAHVEADSAAALTLHSFADLPAAEPLTEAVPASPGTVAAVFYTSGTTGRPKGVELTHRSLVGSLVAAAALPLGIRSDEAVVSLPIAHIMGFVTALGLACAGVPVYFLPHFNPVHVLDAIEQRRASVYVGVPAMYRMLDEAGAAERNLRCVRLWLSAADAMPADLAARFKGFGATAELPVLGAVGQAAFAEGYGMVETGGGVAAKVSPPFLGFGLGSSMGMALPGYHFRVVDDDDRPVRRGQVGELWVKGPGVLTGYRGDAEATAAMLTDDGWLRTGDLARQGPVGLVFFAGRKKDVIKHGGYSVYAVEVEQALEEHPDVIEAAVIGLPDATKGEVPAAVLRLAAGRRLNQKAMKAWAAERLSDYKQPVRYVTARELPRTGTKKVQRAELLALFD